MDKMKMHTPNMADENYRELAALFPNAVTESIDPETGEVVRAIDADVLRQEISGRVVEGREERYQFTWPDKKKAMLAANAPIAATLRPVRADSVGRDGTPGGWDSENLYIEGILLTMYDARLNFSAQVAEELRNYFGDRVYDAVIPRNVRLAEAPSHGRPVTAYDPASKGSRAYKAAAAEFLRRQG